MSRDDEAHAEQTFALADMQFPGPSMEVPDPPQDMAPQAQDDFRSVALLAANGVAATQADLIAALAAQTGVLLHAAAHASGSCHIPAAVPLLRAVAMGSDDQAAVEAAYALVRLGHNDGRDGLHAALQRPLGAYLSPVLAAGYLAQLGDPSGFAVVREGLASEFLATRMLACKQLLSFMPFHGHIEEAGEPLDVLGLFRRALHDPEPSVQGQALAQLRSVGPSALPLVEHYLSGVQDHYLRQLAQGIAANLAGGQ
ncbi:MAG: hypothetical protein NVSMB32_14270 [Actinomycetota bacterium]